MEKHSVSVDNDQYERLQAISTKTGMPIDYFVQCALEDWLLGNTRRPKIKRGTSVTLVLRA